MTTRWRQAWGGAHFGENEEEAQFRFRFLLVVLINAVFITSVFGLADALGAVQLSPVHRWAVRSSAVLDGLLLLGLWGRRERFQFAVWAHWGLSLGLNVSGLLTVPQDELRVLWFFMHLAGSFMLLGPGAGVFSGGLLWGVAVVANGHSAQPYSPAAMVTLSVAMLATTWMFWAYASQMHQARQAVALSRERLRQLSMHDPLTGVFNARAFQALCEPPLRQAQAEARWDHALLFIDLDHFKQVNDRHGHAAGDAVLCAAATCLQTHLRAADVLGRVGGEEFCVFAPHTSLAGAVQLGEKLRAALEALQPTLPSGQRLPISASIGVAAGRPGHQGLSDLQREADQAMYQAKASGRNRVCQAAS